MRGLGLVLLVALTIACGTGAPAPSATATPSAAAAALPTEVLPSLADQRLIGFVHTGRAVIRQHLGDTAGAEADIRDAFAAWDRSGDPQVTDRTVTMFAAAEIAFASGNVHAAADHLRHAISSRRSTGEAQEPVPFEFLAHIAAATGDADRALRLLGIADRLMEGHGSGAIAWWRLADRSWLPRAELVLGGKARIVRDEGRRFPPEAAVSYALGERVVAAGLTDREHEVAALIAEGLTDKEIAAHLRISDRTAENHVQHIREKLGVRSRSQIARWIGQTASA